MLYFMMFFLFLIIVVAPVIAGNKKIVQPLLKIINNAVGLASSSQLGLLQPLDAGLNDTVTFYTGSGLPGGYQSGTLPPYKVMYSSANVHDLKRGL